MSDPLDFGHESLEDVSLPVLFRGAHRFVENIGEEPSSSSGDALAKCERVLEECGAWRTPCSATSPSRPSRAATKDPAARGRAAPATRPTGAAQTPSPPAPPPAARKIDALSLFSANEDKDDIQTAHLRYLLVPSHLAHVLSSTPERDPEARGRLLARALASYREFIARCLDKDLLGDEAKREASRDPSEVRPGARAPPRPRGSPPGPGPTPGQPPPRHSAARPPPQALDPAQARDEKIARFKRERAIQRRLEDLQALRTRAARDRADEDGDLDGAEVPGVDDEVERELWLLRVDEAALRALSAGRVLREELGLLEHAARAREGAAGGAGGGGEGDGRARGRGGDAGGDGAGPPPMLGRLHEIFDHLSGRGPGPAPAKRQEIVSGLLRPGHHLPTMSLAELGERELAEAVAREARQAEAAAERAARKAAVREGSDDEEERARVMRMDEFTDQVRRGVGNSNTKPVR